MEGGREGGREGGGRVSVQYCTCAYRATDS